ncbi:3-keto-5-aminohexanoate cleavage protein [Acidisoma cellulosilytica]|uniref:3-keto-5-aminohexanoate cleavage protein n=1 Tax=Acidisoma cellulosilyticum TaxID=2802395 RepID=A0A963Z5Q8_9PROT|nr:3-keto-5-aminohexanoate cleavage protein [Acidisoma cellulosilyticum]MCB8883089.1 3-keto-5-aminohexanoate cleavage protein [Acidisoma cellulosilyticum]
MPKSKKTIITCAITGAGLTPSMSPYLPISAEDMIRESVEAAKAGAAMLHLHARKPEDGRPTNDIAVWNSFVPGIRAGCDAIINMSASMGATADDRVSAAIAVRPEVATVIVGSMNYGRFKKAHDQGITEFKHEWEREFFGPSSYEVVTQNTFAKIDRMIDIFTEHKIAMEFECYDVGHIHILAYHLKNRKIDKPIIVQFLTGILGGITSDIDHLLHMKQTTEKLFGSDCEIFLHGTGPVNIRTAVAGALMGTSVRVGQEDNLFDKPGLPFTSNAAQVSRLKQILDGLNIEIATPAEARARLGLTG